jgi:hypothetical protein
MPPYRPVTAIAYIFYEKCVNRERTNEKYRKNKRNRANTSKSKQMKRNRKFEENVKTQKGYLFHRIDMTEGFSDWN